MDWILNNWAEIALALLAFADVLVSLNPKWGGEKLGYLRAVVTALAATAAASKLKEAPTSEADPGDGSRFVDRPKTPGLLDEVGDLLPDRGALGVIRRVLIASGKLSETDRQELDRLIDAEISFSAEVTKRWEADLKADSPLAKVIRPSP